MLQSERYLTIGQICAIKFGPNPQPYIIDPETGHRKSRPHPQYCSMRKMFKDDPRTKQIGTGKRNRHYGVPASVVEEKLGGRP